jgi:hypothetical protein
MVATILAVNRIGVEGGVKLEIGKARFLMRGLAIHHQDCRGSAREPSRQIFLKKKKAGGNSWAGAPSIRRLYGRWDYGE